MVLALRSLLRPQRGGIGRPRRMTNGPVTCSVCAIATEPACVGISDLPHTGSRRRYGLASWRRGRERCPPRGCKRGLTRCLAGCGGIVRFL